MRTQASVLVGVFALLALMVGACEKPVREARSDPAQPSPTQGTSRQVQAADPTTASAAIPTTSPKPDTRPSVAVLTINGVDVQFPPTKLLLHEHDGGKRVVAELSSDLPKSALRKYDGNELYLEMEPTGATSGKIEGASWRFKSDSSRKADSPNGIFLNGQTTHLQPFDVLVKFERPIDDAGDGALVVHMMGQFRAYEAGTPDALAPFVGVRGTLPVEIVHKR